MVNSCAVLFWVLLCTFDWKLLRCWIRAYRMQMMLGKWGSRRIPHAKYKWVSFFSFVIIFLQCSEYLKSFDNYCFYFSVILFPFLFLNFCEKILVVFEYFELCMVFISTSHSLTIAKFWQFWCFWWFFFLNTLLFLFLWKHRRKSSNRLSVSKVVEICVNMSAQTGE